MRNCPNCGTENRYGGTMCKCEGCGALYCVYCRRNEGGGCPYCGCHEYKPV